MTVLCLVSFLINTGMVNHALICSKMKHKVFRKRRIGVFITLLSIIFLGISCQKNPFWVGETEYVTFMYTHTQTGGPKIDEVHDDKSPFIYYENTSATKIGNGRVQLRVDGVSVKTINKIFNISDLVVKEKQDDRVRETFDELTELEDNVFLEKSDLATVVVIDMTTSMKDEIEITKQYAKDFIDVLADSSANARFAVVFFSGKDNISATPFFTNATRGILKQQIDNYSTFGDRTAVLAATYKGIQMLDELDFDGSKSVILFSDGSDTDSDQPDSTLSRIQNSNYNRMAIGFRAKGFKSNDLQDIATSKASCYVFDKPADIEDSFLEINQKLTSKYDLIYERSDQVLNTARLIKFIITTNRVEE